jgi:hypothetical protein
MQPLPTWKQKSLRILGGALLLASVVVYVWAIHRVESGDVQVMVQAASQSQYTEHMSNAAMRAAFVLFIGGLYSIAYSFSVKKVKIWQHKTTS